MIDITKKILSAERRLQECIDNRVACAKQYVSAVQKEEKAIKKLEFLRSKSKKVK